MHNAEELCGIQFGFTDGTRTPLFETKLAKDDEQELKRIEIDPNVEVRKVSMKVWNGYAIKGLRLTDAEGKHHVDLNWANVGQWSVQEIPEGQEILGLKCNTSNHVNAIPRIGLILWMPRVTRHNEDMCRTCW